MPPQVTTWWDRVSAVAPAPDLGLVLLTALLAFAATSAPGTWRHTRHLVTIAHEGAHGVAALASGRRLAGIRLHSDTSGLTVSVGRDRGFGMVVTSAAGYVGPALVGLLAATLLAHGHAVGVLWVLLVLLALLLLQIRNFFGLWAVLLAGTGLVVVTRWTPADVQLVIAYVVTWFLLLGAPRAVVELQRERRRRGGRERTSDAAALARLTRLPAVLWVGFFLVVTVGCLLLGCSDAARGRRLTASSTARCSASPPAARPRSRPLVVTAIERVRSTGCPAATRASSSAWSSPCTACGNPPTSR